MDEFQGKVLEALGRIADEIKDLTTALENGQGNVVEGIEAIHGTAKDLIRRMTP